jgi:membrane protein YqaA with SNARE-associated domain
MLQRLYQRCMGLSASPKAAWWLAAVAFAEASFFPFPPDILLIGMALARPQRAFLYAGIATIGSVAGGALGYLIGASFFRLIAEPLLAAYGYGPAFHQFQLRYDQYGLWIILLKGLTPIPYKIVTIASGAAHFNFPVFLAASVATRGARFFLLALVLRLFGEPIRDFVEKRLVLVTTAVVALCLAGFALLRYV